MNYTLSDFDFDLPESLIAQFPLAERTASRLLDVAKDGLHDRQFADLPGLLRAGDVLIFNDTRVLKARFWGVKASGGKVQVLVERVLSNQPGEHKVLVQMRASKSPSAGAVIRLADAFDVIVGERQGEFFTLYFPSDVFALLEQYGNLPLPPYIAHQADEFDEQRYQTVYNRVPGAVAAPTAGLHFDQNLLEKCQQMGVNLAYVTLHVGAGTFQPVRSDDLSQHQMHSEWYEIPAATVAAVSAARAAGGRVIAVGTTSMRALESASRDGELQAESRDTQIFITPGYQFKTVDALVTNFHLPKSTLMMLVSAFAGYERIKTAYQHAIQQQYRFFSYGDAMFLRRA